MSQSTECSLLACSSCSKPKLKFKGSRLMARPKKEKKEIGDGAFPTESPSTGF